MGQLFYEEARRHKALQVQVSRERYCQRADTRFLDELNHRRPRTMEAVVQLFRILAQLLQGSTPQREQDDSRTDRKLRRRTQEKEQAHGLKHS